MYLKRFYEKYNVGQNTTTSLLFGGEGKITTQKEEKQLLKNETMATIQHKIWLQK